MFFDLKRILLLQSLKIKSQFLIKKHRYIVNVKFFLTFDISIISLGSENSFKKIKSFSGYGPTISTFFPIVFFLFNQQKVLAVINYKSVSLFFLGESITETKITLSRVGNCICSHPHRSVLAVGVKKGTIHLFDINSRACLKQFFWHHNNVGDLCFSSDGNYLFSGGRESVLVRWHIATSRKTYLPRLGSPISNLILHNEELYIFLFNNEILIADPNNMKLIKNITNFQRSFQRFIELKYEPNSETLVFNGRLGCLTFYCPSSCSVVYLMNVVIQNFIGYSSAIEAFKSQYEITHVKFSDNGSWLFTIEQSLLTRFSRLKSWKIESENRSYNLKYTNNSPHEGVVCCLDSCLNDQSLDILVTCGDERVVKIWYPNVDVFQQDNFSWECNYRFSFDEIPKMALFSPKRNHLIVSDLNYLYFFDFPVFTFSKLSISHVNKVLFNKNDKNCILINSSTSICLYNLVDSKFVWVKTLSSKFCDVDPISGNICVIETLSFQLHVFLWNNGETLQSFILPFSYISMAVFGSPFKNKPKKLLFGTSIYFLSGNEDLYVISEDPVKLSSINYFSQISITENNEKFNKILVKPSINATQSISLLNIEKDFMDKLKTTPSHLLPSPEVICKHHLNALIALNLKNTRPRPNIILTTPIEPQKSECSNPTQSEKNLTNDFVLPSHNLKKLCKPYLSK